MKTYPNLFKFLLILLIISFFAIEVKSQTFNYTWDNQSGCDWQIMIFDGASPPVAYIASGTSAPAYTGVGLVPASGCLGNTSRTPTTFKFIDPNCGCEIIISAITGGTNSTVVTDCANQGCSPCHPTNPTTQIDVSLVSSPLTCSIEYIIVIQ